MTGAAKFGLVVDGLTDDPFGERPDMAGLLGHGHEQVGRDATAARVGPAGEGLDGSDAIGAEIVFGLVVQREFAVAEGGHQFADQRQVAGRVAVAEDVEGHGPAMGGAGLVDGDGGPVDGRGHVAIGLTGAGDAGGQGDVDRRSVEEDRGLRRLADPGGGVDRFLIVAGVQDEAQNAGADPRHRRAAVETGKAMADGGQQAGHRVIADGVAQDLEAIDADENDVGRLRPGGGALQRETVAESGLLIVQGHVGQPRVRVERMRPAKDRRKQRRQVRERTAHPPASSAVS